MIALVISFFLIFCVGVSYGQLPVGTVVEQEIRLDKGTTLVFVEWEVTGSQTEKDPDSGKNETGETGLIKTIRVKGISNVIVKEAGNSVTVTENTKKAVSGILVIGRQHQ